jgi:hypothetical protein
MSAKLCFTGNPTREQYPVFVAIDQTTEELENPYQSVLDATKSAKSISIGR